MKVLIIGATGHVGRPTVDAALDVGHEVTLGAGDSEGHGRFVFRHIVGPMLLGRITEDRTRQEELVRHCRVPERVIVRPTELSDDAPAPVRFVEDLENDVEPGRIARHDVATTLVDLLVDQSRDGRAVTITD